MKLDDRKTCGEMGRRNAINRTRNQIYLIEGEHVTLVQIAARIGIEIASASDKMRRLRRNPKIAAITWELLGAKKTA